VEPDLRFISMDSKNIILFERYDGVRFVLERSLLKFKDNIDIYSSHWKNEIKNRIENQNVDLLITELSKANPDGFELTCFARKVAPELNIIWITVLGCDVFTEQRERLGNIMCIEKPLEIKNFRKNVLQALDISH
jgi:DNA-binding NtrC family response regulator